MSGSIAFGLVAACALASAIFVVRSANLIRAVLWLGVTLLATAVLYAMMDASFLAAVQVLLYVGGVVTLMIFGVMITRRHEGIVVRADTAKPLRAMVPAAALFGIVAAAIRATDGLDADVSRAAPAIAPADLGRALMHDQVLAFEVASVLLLGALVGAIVIARRRDPGDSPLEATPASITHPATTDDAGVHGEAHP